MCKVADVVEAMAAIAPPALALDGDPVGLHAGNLGSRVTRVTVALDASLAAIEAARKNRSEMLVVHHPRFYRGLSTLSEHDASGRRAVAIVQAGLAVFSAHTNLDIAEGGTNDALAEIAGIEKARPVGREREERLLKLAVFVPATHIDQVLRAMCDAGAGAIGDYSDCTFRARGIGTFHCGKDTKPFIGEPGSYEEADEYRLETVFGEFSRSRVIAAMLQAHPYEEAAYDLYPLAMPARVFGLGRVGELPRPESLDALAGRFAKATRSPMVQCSARVGRVRRIAVWAGAGADANALIASGAEAVVAGEVGYHELENFADAGVAVITLGHGYSETPALKPLARKLGKLLPGLAVSVYDKIPFGMRNIT